MSGSLWNNPIGTERVGQQSLTMPSPNFQPAPVQGLPVSAAQMLAAHNLVQQARQITTMMALGMSGTLREGGIGRPLTTQTVQSNIPSSVSGETMAARPPSPFDLANKIGSYAGQLGYSVEPQGSALSRSSYLSLSHDALPDTTVKVRVSDHDLPPSYGPPGDYDVHYGAPRQFSTDWINAVADLARRVNQQVPAPIQSQLTRMANLQAARDAADAQARAAAAARIEARGPMQRPNINDTLRQAYPQLAPQSGQAGSRQIWQKLRQKFEAEFPSQAWWLGR